MQTDWLLVRRLAAELDDRLRGARIASVGLLPDGRFAMDLRGGRAGRARLAVDAFAATPVAWLASEAVSALDLRAAPGWSRAFAAALEGRRIEGVRGRAGDRLIAIDARARSRFGVDSDVRLVLELAPKFGNLVILKDRTIVAAAREFEPGGSRGAAARTTVAGGAYEPPPLREARPDPAAERAAFAAYAAAATRSRAEPSARRASDDAEIVRALRRERPLLTPLLAASVVAAATDTASPSGESFRAALLARADDAVTRAGEPGEILTYRRRDDGSLAFAHLVPLHAPREDGTLCEARVPEIAPLFAELAERHVAPVARDSFERRRSQLLQRLERRRRSVAASLASLHEERLDDGEGDRLRRAGEALFQHQDAVAPGATRFELPEAPGTVVDLDPALDARGNATAIFKRYRKLANRRVHAERRFATVETEAARLDDLAWELTRAEPETLPELARAIEELVPSGAARETKPATVRKGKPARPASLRPHRIDLGDGARLFVGRSPYGNAEVTFRLARPDDWWFHARGVPGAHVVLQLDEAREPTEAEVRAAAAAAAAYSSVAAADRIDVDRTRRKYVRKRDAGPGQVWYTNALTIAVARPTGRPDPVQSPLAAAETST